MPEQLCIIITRTHLELERFRAIGSFDTRRCDIMESSSNALLLDMVWSFRKDVRRNDRELAILHVRPNSLVEIFVSIRANVSRSALSANPSSSMG